MDNKFELDLTLLSQELKLLLELLKEENEENIQRNQKELFSKIDWAYFLHLARHHRVYPLIYVRLKKIEEGIVPKKVIETLYQEYKRNTLQMLQLSAEMEKISKVFTANEIRLLFLKGPVIAYDLYGDISLRTSKDLDILVSVTDLEEVERLLLSMGYERGENPTVLNERKWRHNHIAYLHSNKLIQIEIHWSLHPRPMKEPSFNELWGRRRISSLTSYPVPLLGEEDLFLFLVAHGARHGWFRLRWLKDIDQMIRKREEFAEIYALLKRYEYYFALGQALILTSQLFQTPLNTELRTLAERKRSRKVAGKIYLDIRNSKEQPCYRSHLFALENGLQKFIFMIILFYPCSTDMETLRLPKPLHFLYFPLRPFLWTWRKTKRFISSAEG